MFVERYYARHVVSISTTPRYRFQQGPVEQHGESQPGHQVAAINNQKVAADSVCLWSQRIQIPLFDWLSVACVANPLSASSESPDGAYSRLQHLPPTPLISHNNVVHCSSVRRKLDSQCTRRNGINMYITHLLQYFKKISLLVQNPNPQFLGYVPGASYNNAAPSNSNVWIRSCICAVTTHLAHSRQFGQLHINLLT